MMPSAQELRAQGRAVLRGRWWAALALCLVAGLLGANSTGPSINFSVDIPTEYFAAAGSSELYYMLQGFFITFAGFALFISLLLFIIGGATLLGSNLYFCRLHRGQDAAFSTLFERFSIFGRALGLRLLMWIKIFLWSLLLFIPGIIASYRYAMAPYLMAENPDLKAGEAIAMSCEMMRGHKGELFWLHLSFIGWAILCAFSLGIGYLFLDPYIRSSEAAFFLELLSRRSPYHNYGSAWDSSNGSSPNDSTYSSSY